MPGSLGINSLSNVSITIKHRLIVFAKVIIKISRKIKVQNQTNDSKLPVI